MQAPATTYTSIAPSSIASPAMCSCRPAAPLRWSTTIAAPHKPSSTPSAPASGNGSPNSIAPISTDSSGLRPSASAPLVALDQASPCVSSSWCA